MCQTNNLEKFYNTIPILKLEKVKSTDNYSGVLVGSLSSDTLASWHSIYIHNMYLSLVL